MIKSLEFFFQSYNKYFINEFFFRFGQILFNIARMFVAHQRFLRSLLIPYLITLSLKKEIFVLE